MLHTRLVHLICWQVAILSSPPVNEPVSHIQHQKTLTSCFPGPVWGCSDPGWGLSGPQRAVAKSPFFFSRVITRWHFVDVLGSCLMAADGNTQKCDLWLGKTKAKQKRQRQPACPSWADRKRDPSPSLILWPVRSESRQKIGQAWLDVHIERLPPH